MKQAAYTLITKVKVYVDRPDASRNSKKEERCQRVERGDIILNKILCFGSESGSGRSKSSSKSRSRSAGSAKSR